MMEDCGNRTHVRDIESSIHDWRDRTQGIRFARQPCLGDQGYYRAHDDTAS